MSLTVLRRSFSASFISMPALTASFLFLSACCSASHCCISRSTTSELFLPYCATKLLRFSSALICENSDSFCSSNFAIWLMIFISSCASLRAVATTESISEACVRIYSVEPAMLVLNSVSTMVERLFIFASSSASSPPSKPSRRSSGDTKSAASFLT